MKLRFPMAVIIFLSAYSPLAIIFAIQDFDFEAYSWEHPYLVSWIFAASLISCIIVWASVKLLKTSSPPVKVIQVSNRSGELINYSIPYMISFFVMDLGDINMLVSFAFFMCIMFWMTLKTHNIFINPVLAMLGYNLYDVRYELNKKEYENFFLIKGERLSSGEQCRIIEISEQLYLVADRNPEV